MGEHGLRRLLLSIVLVAAPIAASPFFLSPAALAQNDQEGNSSSEVDQDGDASVGDAIGGQEVSVTGGARTRVNATNSSKDVRAETGEAEARNSASGFTGQLSDTGDDETENSQEGDNESELSQSADASTGDAIGGQVIGVSSRGTVEINATNVSDDVDLITGDAEATNEADVFTGLVAIAEDEGTQLNLCGNNEIFDIDICLNFDETEAENSQEGDNSADVSQRADATTGDGIGGQVIGVSGSDVVVNATNTSTDVDIRTGDAESTNIADVQVGPLAMASNEGTQANICGNNIGNDPFFNLVICANIALADADNVQDGDNSADVSQNSDASSGDGVAGQVIGVDSTGDSRVTAANTSEDVDVRTGDADATNDALVVAGPNAVASNTGTQLNLCGNNIGSDPDINIAVCINAAIASPDNEQTGDNSADVSQSADAASGDGVGGQMIGVTSAGNSIVDATNSSRNVDVDSGDADATNNADVIVGLLGVATNEGTQLNICGNNIASDPELNIAICVNLASSNPDNVQTGDNEADVGQRADASTGDAVGGQMIGVDSGGDSLIRAANNSENVDADTGDGDASNNADVDVGQTGLSFSEIDQINICGNSIFGSEPDINFALCVNAALTNVENEQNGNNTSDVNQSAGASTGDAVGGQVIGVTSTGDTAVDATNRSENVDADTGDSDSDNNAEIDVGQTGSTTIDEGLDIEICDDAICINALPPATASNVMNGDNDSELSQSTSSHSGDAVAGQMVGVTGRDRGSADLVLHNSSVNTRATSGDDDEDNNADTFVGLLVETILI